MNNDFSNVKIGDRLWSAFAGWGTVSSIDTISQRRWVFIKADKLTYLTYMYDKYGVHNGVDGFPQSLFFEEMQLIPLPKPEEAKTFDPNKPAKTKGGLSARFLGRIKNDKYPLVFAVKTAWEGHETSLEYTENGRYDSTNDNSTEDLVNIPEKIEGWVNIYKSFGKYHIGDFHATKDIAKSVCNKNKEDRRDIIARKLIFFEAGEGL